MTDEEIIQSLVSYVGMLSLQSKDTPTNLNKRIIANFMSVVLNLLEAEGVNKEEAIKPLYPIIVNYLIEKNNIFKEASGEDSETYINAIKLLKSLAKKEGTNG